MLRNLIKNDVRQNRLLSAATVFFMTVSAALLILTALLFGELLGTIGSLMERAQVPDLIQMHAGEVEEEKLAQFVQSRPEVSAWQLCRFLNLDNSQLVLGEHNMAGSTQDNGLAVQSEQFDFLLDTNGEKPEVAPGEVYVPIGYRAQYDLAIGDTLTAGTAQLRIAGFLRDAQMNSMMSSSKRFLVSSADYASLRAQGEQEYLIEFLLEDGADVNSLQTAYAEQKLPANGPAITKGLIRLVNALSDGTMIFVIFLVSILVLLISLLCIHFILSIQMERDRKDVGMLKALGIDRRAIRRLYFTKYLLFSACGGAIGLAAALIAKGPLSSQLHELYGAAEKSAAPVIIAILSAASAEGIILFSVHRALRKIDRVSALDALFQRQYKKRSKMQYVLIGAVAAACMFLMLVPHNLYHTLSDPSFVTYMGIGSGEIRMDVRQREDLDSVTEQIAAALEIDPAVDQYTALQTSSYLALLPDGSEVNLTAEAGDHSVFPVRYSEGTAPKQDKEIALSALNAEELGLSVGDTLYLAAGSTKIPYTVCGIYSDITNGGKTAKISNRPAQTPVIWSVLYVSLLDCAEEESWMETYRLQGADVVKISDYVRETYAQTLNQLLLISRWVCGIGVMVAAAVLGLFSRLIIERNRYAISLRKALGFTSGACEREYFAGSMLAAGIGVIAGLILGCWGGEILCGAVLSSFGAEGFRFVIQPVQAYVGIPRIVLFTAALAIGWGTAGIQKIKAYECCRGRE